MQNYFIKLHLADIDANHNGNDNGNDNNTVYINVSHIVSVEKDDDEDNRNGTTVYVGNCDSVSYYEVTENLDTVMKMIRNPNM